jgi:hypothetical protein
MFASLLLVISSYRNAVFLDNPAEKWRLCGGVLAKIASLFG